MHDSFCVAKIKYDMYIIQYYNVLNNKAVCILLTCGKHLHDI